MGIMLAAAVTGLVMGSAAEFNWTRLTEELERYAPRSENIQNVLFERAPEFANRVLGDERAPSLFHLWGESLNFDSGAKEQITDPAILEAVASLMRAPYPRGPVMHAGVMHTYGYMLSNLVTPYGGKRDRWVSGVIEAGFGIAPGLLGPVPPEGSQFGNVTAFATRLAYPVRSGGRHRNLAILDLGVAESGGHTVAAELLALDVAALMHGRRMLIESVPALQLALVTQLIPFPKGPQGRERYEYLLIYRVEDQVDRTSRLVTLFPIRSSDVARILKADRLGDNQWIDLRFNAHHPRWSATGPGLDPAYTPKMGTRSLER